MLSMTRRFAIAGAVFLLSACGGGNEVKPGQVPLSSESDIVYGDADAPLTLIEYAAVTCGACGYFNNEVLSDIKEKYVETGKLKIITREVLYVPPAEVNLAAFAIARCAGEENYSKVLDDLFENQTGILSAVRAGAGTQALQAVAARHGLNKTAFEACIANPEIKQTISDVSDVAAGLGLGTPTLYLNGRELKGATARTLEGLSEILDAELARRE